MFDAIGNGMTIDAETDAVPGVELLSGQHRLTTTRARLAVREREHPGATTLVGCGVSALG